MAVPAGVWLFASEGLSASRGPGLDFLRERSWSGLVSRPCTSSRSSGSRSFQSKSEAFGAIGGSLSILLWSYVMGRILAAAPVLNAAVASDPRRADPRTTASTVSRTARAAGPPPPRRRRRQARCMRRHRRGHEGTPRHRYQPAALGRRSMPSRRQSTACRERRLLLHRRARRFAGRLVLTGRGGPPFLRPAGGREPRSPWPGPERRGGAGSRWAAS